MPTDPDSSPSAGAALFTDLYQLTMMQAYVREDLQETAVFDLFIRRLGARNYLIACGLDTALHYLETLRFTADDLAYLAGIGSFEDAFLKYLAGFRFTGNVYAVPEGTIVFPDEPILVVEAPLPEAQLVETFLLNQITFQTGIASKARRVVDAAQGRTVVDFGTRRMHGTDAALKAVRAYTIAGVAATSNVLAGRRYGVPVSGTMAHSYVEAHLTERDAFRAFARLYPGTTLLVDTYDTHDGVQAVIDLIRDDPSIEVGALRLDSGDLAALARDARRQLDAAGLTGIKLFASSSLDEFTIRDLLAAGAPIDGFGVGTRMGTMADQPYLDSVYKLCAYAGTGRMKLSTAKSNYPGRKQVYRVFEDGPDNATENSTVNPTAARDVIATADEPPLGEPLLACVMQDGRRTEAGRGSLDAARRRAEGGLERLPAALRRLEPADPAYPVVISDALRERTERVRARATQR